MKTKSIILSLVMLVSFAGLSAQKKQTVKSEETVTFAVPMDCQKCVTKIKKNIAYEKGVKDLDVNLEKQTVAVTYDPKKTDVEKLQKGFKKIDKVATVQPSACCAKTASECPKAKAEGCPKATGECAKKDATDCPKAEEGCDKKDTKECPKAKAEAAACCAAKK